MIRGGLGLQAGAGAGLLKGSGTEARSCLPAPVQLAEAPGTTLLLGREEPAWAGAAPVGRSLTSWGLSVSLPVSEPSPGSRPAAQGSHWLWGPHHQMGEGSRALAGSHECQSHRGGSGKSLCLTCVVTWTSKRPQGVESLPPPRGFLALPVSVHGTAFPRRKHRRPIPVSVPSVRSAGHVTTGLGARAFLSLRALTCPVRL